MATTHSVGTSSPSTDHRDAFDHPAFVRTMRAWLLLFAADLGVNAPPAWGDELWVCALNLFQGTYLMHLTLNGRLLDKGGADQDDGGTVAAVVDDLAHSWHDLDGAFRAQWAGIEARLRLDPLATPHILLSLTRLIDRVTAFLSERCGYDLARDDWAEDSDAPLGTRELANFYSAVCLYFWLRTMAAACTHAVIPILSCWLTAPDVVNLATINAVRTHAIRPCWFMAGSLTMRWGIPQMEPPGTSAGGAIAMAVAGWSRSHLSLARNKRLLAALPTDTWGGRSPQAVLSDLLPATVLEAFRRIAADQPGPSSLVNHAAWLLEHGGAAPSDISDARDFERLESARAELQALLGRKDISGRLEKAGLSPREREAFLLHSYHGLSRTETAQVLGISDGSVNKVLARAKNKLSPK